MAASRKRKKSGGSQRIVRAASIAVLGVVLIAALLAGMLVFTKLLAPVSSDVHAPVKLVTVQRGWGPREIGTMLEREHLIWKAAGFRLAIRLNHMSGKMRAGQYALSPAMSPRQMAEIIALGRTASTMVVVPEGFTVDQIAARLARDGLVDRDRFVKMAKTGGRTFRVRDFTPPSDNLEGYLYPDTYYVPKGMGEREIIAMMLSTFREQALYRDGGALAKRGKSVQAVVTLASLVEREAKVDGDRALIAAALVNRLNRKMPLQCDATVEYALPKHKDRLYFKDLKVDSPYNTYIHAGLPPTPIASPGWASIEAALNPAPVNYLYYVARKNGTHVFTTTFEDFKRAKAQLDAKKDRA
jgi:UPF0755 protein